jgi:hypothetical protein
MIAGGLCGLLPILGVELIPIGLLLIAQEVPFLRGRVGALLSGWNTSG